MADYYVARKRYGSVFLELAGHAPSLAMAREMRDAYESAILKKHGDKYGILVAIDTCDECPEGIIDPNTDCCDTCGVHHGDPCPECDRRGYHKADCSRVDKAPTEA